MPVESSRGLGQGAAQVFDTSGLANQYAQQEDAKAKAKYTQQKDLEKKIAEVSGGLDGIFKEKIFATRDREAIQKLYDDGLKEMEGKWHLAGDPRTPEARRWNEIKQNAYLAAQQSYETRELLKPLMEDLNKDPYAYTDETKKYITDTYNTPLALVDPNKIKKVNDFNMEEYLNTKILPSYQKNVLLNNKNNIGFVEKDGYNVTGTTTVATDKDKEDAFNLLLQDVSNDPKKRDWVTNTYGEEEQETGINKYELMKRDYMHKFDYNDKDFKYDEANGSGKEEPYNPSNIVTDIKLKTGTGEMVAIKGWEGWEGISGYGNSEEIITPTSMYQTQPFKAVVPVTNKSIDATTGKPTKDMGTISVTYGSPAVYYFDKDGKVTNDTKNGKPVVMVHGMVDKGGIEGGALNILTPIDELTTVIQKTGLSVDEVKQGLLGKNTTTSSYNIKGKSYSLAELKGMGYTEEQVSQFKTK